MRPTPFSTWLTTQLAVRHLDQEAAARLLGVHVATVYDWLAGKDPRAVGLIQAGISAKLLGTAHLSHHGNVSPLPVREASMAQLEEAQDRLARIFFRYKPDSKEWRSVIEVLKRVDPRGV